MKKIISDNAVISDLINISLGVVGYETARLGVRALCRHFGGQIIYVPNKKTDGKSAESLRGILADAVGDGDGEKILEKVMFHYGGLQVYMPLERCAFRRDIAAEIFGKYDGEENKIGDLCREYNMSFTQVYKLWYEGRKVKLEKEAPALDFGEGYGFI
jgi:Mor family transcriptional regulator